MESGKFRQLMPHMLSWSSTIEPYGPYPGAAEQSWVSGRQFSPNTGKAKGIGLSAPVSRRTEPVPARAHCFRTCLEFHYPTRQGRRCLDFSKGKQDMARQLPEAESWKTAGEGSDGARECSFTYSFSERRSLHKV